MSEVKRYRLDPESYAAEHPQGDLVDYQDYARLKAEVAYLKGEEYPYTELGSMMPKYLLEHWVKENARLKAEVERLTNCKSEADRLKAEVERLRASSFVTAVPVEEYEKLKAEVERLRKAGDVMYNGYIRIYGGHVGNLAEEYTAAWLAAKEGKQP